MNELDRTTQENIYIDIIEKIESLNSETNTEDFSDERINMLYQGARDHLLSIREKLTNELKSLQEHAEWDSFTVAFYGETNAGKSTLIETLRIHLNEETKLKDREEYDVAYKELIVLHEKCIKIEQEVSRIEEERDRYIQRINESIDEAKRELESIDSRQKYDTYLIEANNLARAELRSNSLGDFFKVLFGRDEYSLKNAMLREEIPRLKQEYKECRKKVDNDSDNLNSEKGTYDQTIEQLKAEIETLEQDIKPLRDTVESRRDGQIIGTGRRDFTQEVTAYRINIKNQSLTLLDLPGIEGDESKYVDMIVSALEKAHAVFYISKSARPPQNGEGETSMFSKVGEQLSGQTEVYFIFNRPTQKPEQVVTINIINNDMQESLHEVDNRMAGLLGDKYLGHIVVSAMPAYLANSNNYGDSESAKRLRKMQEKFLKQFTPEELIGNSNINTIINWIEERLTSNYKEAIKGANYHKILNCIKDTERDIESLNNSFKDLRGTIANELKAGFKAFDARLNSMVNELRDAKRTVSRKFVINSNEILYEEVDQGVDDNELTEMIKEVFEVQSKAAIDLFNEKLKELGKLYANDVADINNKYQKYFSENVEVFNNTSELGFKYEPAISKRDRKTADTAWIIGEVIGTLIFISTSSTIVLVATIIGLLIRVGRFIAKTLDPEKNKAFQRKDIDQNAKNAAAEIEKALQEHNEIVIKKIKENNQEIKNRMEKSLTELDNTLMAIGKVKDGIHKIYEEYNNEGEVAS